MFKSNKIMIQFVILMLLMTFAFPLTGFAKPEKVDVCHWDEDQGTFKLINISERAVDAHLRQGSVFPGTHRLDDNCNPRTEKSSLCSTLDGYVVSPVNSSPGFRIAFTNSELFNDEVVSVTVTNTDGLAYNYLVSISNELYVSPSTTFKSISTPLIAPNTSGTFSLVNLNNPAGNSRFILGLSVFPEDPNTLPEDVRLQNVTFSFTCS